MGLMPTTSTSLPSLPFLPLPEPLPPPLRPPSPLRRAKTRITAIMSRATAPPAPPAIAAVLSSAAGAAGPLGVGDATGYEAAAGLLVTLPGTTPAEMACGLDTTPEATTAATPMLRAIVLALLVSTAATAICSVLALKSANTLGIAGCGVAVALEGSTEADAFPLPGDGDGDACTPRIVVWKTRSRPLLGAEAEGDAAGDGVDCCCRRRAVPAPAPRRR